MGFETAYRVVPTSSKATKILDANNGRVAQMDRRRPAGCGRHAPAHPWPLRVKRPRRKDVKAKQMAAHAKKLLSSGRGSGLRGDDWTTTHPSGFQQPELTVYSRSTSYEPALPDTKSRLPALPSDSPETCGNTEPVRAHHIASEEPNTSAPTKVVLGAVNRTRQLLPRGPLLLQNRAVWDPTNSLAQNIQNIRDMQNRQEQSTWVRGT